MQYADGRDDKSADDIFPPKTTKEHINDIKSVIEILKKNAGYSEQNYPKFLLSLLTLYYVANARSSDVNSGVISESDPLVKCLPLLVQEMNIHYESLKPYANQV